MNKLKLKHLSGKCIDRGLKSSDGLKEFEIKENHPECPIIFRSGAKSMTSVNIDHRLYESKVIAWYESEILKS